MSSIHLLCSIIPPNLEFICMQFKAKDFTPRTPETYDYHCSLLDGPLYKEDSTNYGINSSSALNDIENFHVVGQLPMDIMHVMLEGVLPYELSLMLSYFVVTRKYFKCDQLNNRIVSFSYTNQEAKDIPSPIKPQVFTSPGTTLSQSCELDMLYT